MDSIQSSGLPLLFRAVDDDAFRGPPADSDYAIGIRVSARALTGTQLEACIAYGAPPVAWHLMGDAGPDLDGTDLAPAPLAFFGAGLAASCLAQLLSLARHRYLRLGTPRLRLELCYPEPAPAGDPGDAIPRVRVSGEADSDATAEEFRDLLSAAVAGSPGEALLGSARRGRFSLMRDGVRLEVDGVLRSVAPTPTDPAPLFALARPAAVSSYAAGAIERRQAAEIMFGVDGGARSGLDPDRMPQAHVRAMAVVRGDGLKCIDVHIVKPIGGVFRFLSDDSSLVGGQERAPSGLALMATGLAFCYLTQMGRHARMSKRALNGCRLVQDLGFSLPAHPGKNVPAVSATAPDTHVWVDSEMSDEALEELVGSAERNSPLHAICRATRHTEVD